MNETTTDKPASEWPTEMQWPQPPKGAQGFMLLVFPDRKKGSPGRLEPARRCRLSDLTADELAWVAQTVTVEIKRRPLRGANGSGI